MGLLKQLRRMVPGGTDYWTTDGPVFRCLRCGAEFERQYDTCPECGARFLAEVEES